MARDIQSFGAIARKNKGSGTVVSRGKESKEPLKKAGDEIAWSSHGSGMTLKRGVILAYLPPNRHPAEVSKEFAENVFRSRVKFDTMRSLQPRYLVKVMYGANNDLPLFYAPPIAVVDRQNRS